MRDGDRNDRVRGAPDLGLRELLREPLANHPAPERVLRAMEHPSFRILGHPTGRLLLRRRGHPLDVDRLIRRAKELGRILELNAQPDRLDLDDEACRRAKAAGVAVALSSDAHSTRELAHVKLGIDQARRGGLEAGDVVNALELPDLRRRLARS